MADPNLAHFRIIRKLGGGGMGVVYEAEDVRLSRRVALRFLPESLAGDAKAIQHFFARGSRSLLSESPNICTIHEVDEHNGQPFIVMELLPPITDSTNPSV